MTAATLLVWDAAGRPDVPPPNGRLLTPTEASCALCGELQPVTADVDKAMGTNFSDRGHIRDRGSNRICTGCLWCVSGRPPASLRMWSIIVAPGMPPSNPKAWLQTPGVHLFNRSAPGPLALLLAAPPVGEWLATVAVSAQKHVLPYASTNHGPGRWRIRVEDHHVSATPAEWRLVHATARALRSLGVPADAVMDGQPRYITTPHQLATWRALNDQLRPWLGSPLLNLALWTITKETMK